MKSDPNKTLIAKLNRIKDELEVLARPESITAFHKNLDDLIESLNRLRDGLSNQALERRAADIRYPLQQVIEFLEFAKSDEILKTFLSPVRKAVNSKPKRQAVEIGGDLTNEQIRALLQNHLSKSELKAIAAQRAISVGKSTNEQIRRDILRNLERQEGYRRLASL